MADALDPTGPAAPPRSNGELVFAAPWQSRAFGVTVALHEAGCFSWDQFRNQLVAELGAASDASPDRYWGAWLRATEAVLAHQALVPEGDRRDRLAAYASRPHDHDHDHDHDHEDPVHPHGGGASGASGALP